jgi:hypothetical protein
MTRSHPWRRGFTRETPTQKQIRAAFDAFAPPDKVGQTPEKHKRTKREDDDLEGIGDEKQD